ncbi:MAG TPA: hypothetical protein VFW87_14325 [Pirellulales bacterium]|nr:hypothetical protein [Pirellulales bacterium]
MMDATTHRPLSVSAAQDAGPYIVIPFAQLEQVTSLLDENAISYWVDDEALSVDGKPEVIFVNFSAQTHPTTVQRLLDSVP